MKKFSVSLALAAGALALTSCGTTGGSVAQSVGSAVLSGVLGGNTTTGSTTTSSSSSSSILSGISSLGDVLTTILGNSSSISQSDLVGTWQYTGADCVFESDNLLAKAGGAAASAKIESELNTQLSKFGIKQGACSFTFNSDNTYTANLGGRTISGTYTLDTTNKTVKMTYLAGLASMTPHVAKSGSKISLLMEGDKLLSLMKGVSALSKSTSASAISSILSNYQGLYIGMQLSK